MNVNLLQQFVIKLKKRNEYDQRQQSNVRKSESLARDDVTHAQTYSRANARILSQRETMDYD